MNQQQIVLAWKDAEYRENLTAEQLTLLPDSPVGVLELSDAQMEEVNGGAAPVTNNFFCTFFVKCTGTIFIYEC